MMICQKDYLNLIFNATCTKFDYNLNVEKLDILISSIILYTFMNKIEIYEY